MNYIKSPLNYTGGKYKLLPQILPLMPDKFDIFVDLFTGGANVIANINANLRIANDYNNEVISIYKKFQETSIENILSYIYNQIENYELSMTNADGYNLFRKNYNNSKDKNPLDLFILICYSFNHQIRFNSKGEFNMPFGKNRSQYNKNIEKNLIDFHKAIWDISFCNNDFRILKSDKLKQGSYVYCDPPYLITCASYNEKDGWNETDERDLLNLLKELDSKGIYFGLSNVLVNKGKTNDILNKWIMDNPNFIVHHLNHSYSNCNYHAKDKESSTDEVFITNYKNGSWD